MSDTIMNSLKRLERAGSEHSKAAEKLKQATVDVAGTIARILHETGITADGLGGVQLPGRIGYTWFEGPVLEMYSEDSVETLSAEPSRAACLAFAEALAGGWLDELAGWLEQQTDKDEAAREHIEQAAAKLAEERR